MIEITDRVRYTKAHAKTRPDWLNASTIHGTVVNLDRGKRDRESAIHVLWDDGTRSVVNEDNLRGV